MPSVDAIRLGDNAVYLVDAGEGPLLIDTGPDFLGSWDLLEDAIEHRPHLVVATHGHLDHAGLAWRWQAAGVPVALSARDRHLAARPPLSAPGELDTLIGFVRAAAAPPEVEAATIARLERRQGQQTAAAEAERYVPDETNRWPTALHYRPFTPERVIAGDESVHGVELIANPGHTPGNLVAAVASEGWLFSGDQLLADLDPTPGIQFAPEPREGDWRFRSLPGFVAALERLASQHWSRCFPGHGDPFDDVAAAIAGALGRVERRCERVRRALRVAGPVALFPLCEQLYPRAAHRQFWGIAASVQGVLDVLEARGEARCAGGRWEAA